jgi:FMN phosphatase YigB (HAD superfamily)
MIDGYKALLVDLDGTLIDIEVSFFLDTMLHTMAGHFSAHMDQDTFRDGLFGAIDAIMAEPQPAGVTNLTGFNQQFKQITGLAEELTEELFSSYYHEVFPGFSDHAAQAPDAGRFLDAAREAGYRLALATNPIFPRIAALERMKWGGIDPGVFEFITVMEGMSSCKPRAEYFLELAGMMEVAPEDCLMVGNDVQQDLPAGTVGMGTFLVDRRLVNRTGEEPKTDGVGSLNDLAIRLGLW